MPLTPQALTEDFAIGSLINLAVLEMRTPPSLPDSNTLEDARAALERVMARYPTDAFRSPPDMDAMAQAVFDALGS